jgi:hypothetical protein
MLLQFQEVLVTNVMQNARLNLIHVQAIVNPVRIVMQLPIVVNIAVNIVDYIVA